MTAEFGPRDVDLTLSERFAARLTQHIMSLVSDVSDTVSVRFDPRRATLSISGESEHSGDAFERGVLVGLMYLCNLMLAVCTIAFSAEAANLAADVSAWLGVVTVVPMLFVTGVSVLFVLGSIRLMSKTNVVDHTTEPVPDELDALREQYVDGKINEQELGERAGEVWDR
jgi:uncharacterized membrane protein